MARRNRENESSTTPVEAPAETTDTTEEDTVTVTETEAPAEAEASTTPAPAPAAAPVDLTAFSALVETALTERDETTGELPLVALDPVQTAYRALDGLKAKNAARKSIEDRTRDAMNAGDLTLARASFQLSESLNAGGTKAKAESVPTDPTEAFVQRASTLRLALGLATATVPEGVAEDWADKAKAMVEGAQEQATAYQAWLDNEAEDKGDAPETPAWVVAAIKLAHGKSARVGGKSGGSSTPYVGERRDIGKHILSAFEGVESGTFLTVAEIRKHTSDEYGANPPSAGAISARLFPSSGKVTVEGVTPGTNAAGNKGATKD